MNTGRVEGTEQSLILGIGTGRCGTHTLAEVLNAQPGAHVTHEHPPLLPWHPSPGRPGIRERLQRYRRTRRGRFIGDVASFYLPYIEEAIAAEPGLRVVCLERPREEVVSSFCRWVDMVHPLPTDHWSREPAPGWHYHPVWSRIFPQYETTDRKEGLRLYWDEYHRTVAGLVRRYPEHVRVFPIGALNDESGVRAILSFAGIPQELQVLSVGTRTASAEKGREHPAGMTARTTEPHDSRRCVILVPHAARVDPRREATFRTLEPRGFAVRRIDDAGRVGGARDRAATEALIDGFEETLWVGADVGFNPDDVDRLRSLGEPIVWAVDPYLCGSTPSSQGVLETGSLEPGSGDRLCGIADGAAGLLLVRRRVYQDLQRGLDLPVCDEDLDRPAIPFFQPLVESDGDDHRYLSEYEAFFTRARRCGYRIVAMTAVQFWTNTTTHQRAVETGRDNPS